MEFTKRDYDHLYGETPRPGERAIYNLGFSPREFGNRGYKNLDIEGIALEFAKFEMLYDSNYQQYHWLYSTGYGQMLYDILLDLITRDFPHEVTPHQTASKFIREARKKM